MNETQRPQSHLLTWLKANVIALAVLILAICGSTWTTVTTIRTVIHWADNQENQIGADQIALVKANTDIKLLQDNIVSLDVRVTDLKSRMLELHAQSDEAAAMLRTRLDIIDALGKFAAEHATQPALLTPYKSSAQQGPHR